MEPLAKLARARVVPAEKPTNSQLTTLAVSVVIVAALYLGKDILLPITVAILLSFVLAPLVNVLRRVKLGRVPSIIVAVLLALGIISALAGTVGGQIAELAQDLPTYQSTIRKKLDTVRGLTVGRLTDAVRGIGQELEKTPPAEPPPKPSESSPAPALSPGQALPPALPVEVREPPPSSLTLAKDILAPIVHPLTTLGLILVMAVFILLQKEDLRDRLIRLFGARDLHRTTAAMDDAAHRLSTLFLTQLALNAGFGAAVGAGLYVIGVPSPLLWGIFAMLMRFVPYIGGLAAALLPILLAAAVDPGWSMVLWTLGLFVVVETLVGQIIEPMVYGHSTGLSPVAVVVCAVFWTWLWGPIGLLLSTPITVCLVVLGRHIESLEFLDVMLGNRPALTPVESYYQRMLAGDPDEIGDYAEQLLKDRSLLAYYDGVALPGLRLAAIDAARGVLTDAQIERIRTTVEDVAAQLQTYEDKQPAATGEDKKGLSESEKETAEPPSLPQAPAPADRRGLWQHEKPVVCLGGKGPLDICAAIMLQQLFQKHGLGAEVLPHEAASRHNLPALRLEGVAMICLCSLDLEGTPSHLRYLIRRLRQKWPDIDLIAGLWPPDDPFLKDQDQRQMLGADGYVTSLREAVAWGVNAASANHEALRSD